MTSEGSTRRSFTASFCRNGVSLSIFQASVDFPKMLSVADQTSHIKLHVLKVHSTTYGLNSYRPVPNVVLLHAVRN